MRIRLSPELFIPPVDHFDLIHLFDYGWRGRYRIEVNLEHPDVAEWLNRQDGELQEQCRIVAEVNAHEEAFNPSDVVVEITRCNAPDWSCKPDAHMIPAASVKAARLGDWDRFVAERLRALERQEQTFVDDLRARHWS